MALGVVYKVLLLRHDSGTKPWVELKAVQRSTTPAIYRYKSLLGH